LLKRRGHAVQIIPTEEKFVHRLRRFAQINFQPAAGNLRESAKSADNFLLCKKR
jgi:hypothetical protein